MEDKAVVYSKQSGELPVPVTVRVEWLPNGAVKPRFYWTPDGSCYQVLPNCKCVPLALLKERGEGLRFELRARAIETPETCPEQQFARHETYLYLADNRFCQKNIVDDRYGHAGKEYIRVSLDVFPNGEYELVYFWVHGLRYKVENAIGPEPRGSFCAGGVGILHKIDARLVNDNDDDDPDPDKSVRRPAALYLEINKWFVTIKNH